MRGFGEPLDGAEPPVPLRGKVGHGPSGLVQAVGFNLVEDLSTLFAPADQAGLFQDDQMFGDRLAGERHSSAPVTAASASDPTITQDAPLQGAVLVGTAFSDQLQVSGATGALLDRVGRDDRQPASDEPGEHGQQFRRVGPFHRF